MKKGARTESWGKALIQGLSMLGVQHFCMAPGFRSTPLTLAVAENDTIEKTVHFDERGLGFYALGFAKATQKPVALIVTSGTAVGNLLPAIMEASMAHIPLLLLTSDRPAELRDTMANQTCDQIKIFGDYVRSFVDLPSPTEELPERFLATTLSQAYTKSLYPLPGPVQINCPFPEPFFDAETPEEIFSSLTSYTLPELTLSSSEIAHWAKKLEQVEKGAIVVGADGSCPAMELLAQKLKWPILCDINSAHRNLCGKMTIRYAHHIVKGCPDLDVDLVLHFGGPIVSKAMMQWMKKQKVVHIAPHPNRCDPFHTIEERIVCSPNHFCSSLEKKITPKSRGSFQQWAQLSKELETFLPPLLGQSEPSIIQALQNFATPQTAFFIGNSMPIRDADMFFYPKAPCGPIFANRGLSGIDGNIATCCGIAEKHPVIALIGDQTCLHDLNSLPLLHKTKHPVRLIVINNGGGGIFSFVAIGEKREILDPYFAAAHNFSFRHAAAQFNLPYFSTIKGLENEGPCLIEITTSRTENLACHKKIDRATQEQLCTYFSTVS